MKWIPKDNAKDGEYYVRVYSHRLNQEIKRIAILQRGKWFVREAYGQEDVLEYLDETTPSLSNGGWYAIGVPSESNLPAHSVKDFFINTTDPETMDNTVIRVPVICDGTDWKIDQPRTYRVTRSQMKEIMEAAEYFESGIINDTMKKFDQFENEAVLKETDISMLCSISPDLGVLKKCFPEYFFIPEGEPVLVRDNDGDDWMIGISDGTGSAYSRGRNHGTSTGWKQIIPFTKNPPK